jgi:hypothetical protein
MGGSMAEITAEELLVAEAEKAFKQELDSVVQLTTKAEKYLAAAGAILTLKVLDRFYAPIAGQTTARSALVAFGVVLLLLSMLAALISIRVQQYHTYPPQRKLLKDFLEPSLLTPDAARLMLTKMYLDARGENRLINRSRARLLEWSGAFLVCGFLILIAVYSVS